AAGVQRPRHRQGRQPARRRRGGGIGHGRLAGGTGAGGGPADPLDVHRPAAGRRAEGADEGVGDGPGREQARGGDGGVPGGWWEYLAEVADQRRRTPAHLVRWYHLVGWSLRPGYGDSLDRFRVDQLWKLMHAPPKAQPGQPVVRVAEGGADWWIMWRRVSGGLHASLQHALFERLRPAVLPGKGAKPNPNELAEMWRAAASLERLDAQHKGALGAAPLKPLRRGPGPTYGFWGLARLGGGGLGYGPRHTRGHPPVGRGGGGPCAG